MQPRNNWHAFLSTFTKNRMKDKIFEPARHNETAPAPGMAAVNTFSPEETDNATEKVVVKKEDEDKEDQDKTIRGNS
jgi:hypothetical protein